MTDEQTRARALEMTQNPIFSTILDDMERVEVDRMVHSSTTDEQRAAAAAEVRAVREFRAKITALASDPVPGKPAPA